MPEPKSDDSDDSESMSMIPYDSHRDIVLRHADSIVYFDSESKQITLRNRYRDVDAHSPLRTECPTCGRPFYNDQNPSDTVPGPQQEDQPSFINNDYFRMLARSLPGSAESSAPPSPRRRTIQPARSRLSSPPMVPPPLDAEFVGSAPAPPSVNHGISETAFAPQYFERFFVVEKELGKGGRGVVLLVKHVLDGVSLGHFACKRVPIGDDHSWLEKVLVEVQALQSLSHQNLVSYRHVWLEDYQLSNFGPSVPCAFILQQYCNGGDLHNYVCGPAKVQLTTQQLKDRLRRRSLGEAELPPKPNESKSLSLDEIYPFFRDITAGIRFLHLNGFIHRDLKPSNCLLHMVGGETRILVSDFGEVQYENATRKSTGATGTISYCAPEVLKRESPDGPFGNFTFKSDIFSLGMILYFLCFANLPYRHSNVLHEEREDVARLREEIVSWAGFDEQRKLRPELPPQLYSFLSCLLSLQPDDRPSADEVNHGIRLGGLDKVLDDRHRKAASPEELTPGRRVEKVDSPARGPSPRRSGRRESRSHQSLLQRRQHSPAAHMSGSGLRLRSTPREDSAVFLDKDDGEEEDQQQAIHENRRRSSRGLSRTGRLSNATQTVALVPGSSSVKSSPTTISTPQRQQFLLPAPPQQPLSMMVTKIINVLQTDLSSSTFRIIVLALKLVTAIQPCNSLGLSTNAAILYPLVTFAVVELLIHPYEVWKSLLSMILHGSILWYCMVTQRLCQHHAHDLWNDGQWTMPLHWVLT